MRGGLLLMALAAAISPVAARAQDWQTGGHSTDPDFDTRHRAAHIAAHAADRHAICIKDHARLRLAAAERPDARRARLAAAHEAGGGFVLVHVEGLDCPWCAAAIEKAFASRDEIAVAAVDPRAGTITLVAKPGAAIADRTIRKIVRRRGHEVASIEHDLAVLN